MRGLHGAGRLSVVTGASALVVLATPLKYNQVELTWGARVAGSEEIGSENKGSSGLPFADGGAGAVAIGI